MKQRISSKIAHQTRTLGFWVDTRPAWPGTPEKESLVAFTGNETERQYARSLPNSYKVPLWSKNDTPKQVSKTVS